MSEDGKMEEPKKPEMSAIAVIDQLLIQLTDKILDTQTSVKEGQAQLLIVASTLELLRAIPGKMEAIKERLEALESTVSRLRQQNGELDRAVKNMSEVVQTVTAVILPLRSDLQAHAEALAKVTQERVRHVHYLHYYVWIIIGLFLFSCLLGSLALSIGRENTEYKGSDMVLRSLKLAEDSVLLQIVQGEERKYEADPQQYRDSVTGEEQRRAALTERLIEVNQKNTEIDELKKRKK